MNIKKRERGGGEKGVSERGKMRETGERASHKHREREEG